MNLNATLLGQMITFTVFVWVTMKYVWPFIVKALQERQQKIADGLAAAERAERDLELAQHRIAQQLRDAKVQAAQIIEQAKKRSGLLVEEAKHRAQEEGDRLVAMAHAEIQQEQQRSRLELRKETVNLAIAGAEKILEQNIDDKAHANMFDKLIAELEE